MTLTAAPVVIIGIGNPMRGDDGIGPAALACLEKTNFARRHQEVELVCLDGEASRLIETWCTRHLAIVIDAVQFGSAPGSIHRLELGRDPLPSWAAETSSHSAGLAEAVELARTLRRLPEELIVFGVEPADLTLGARLSGPVRAALPTLIRHVTVAAEASTTTSG